MSATPGDTAIQYMDRTRDYYLALGYDNPYRWAHHDDVPFEPLTKPLADSRLALVTTAAPFRAGAGDQGPGAPSNARAAFFDVRSFPTTADPDLRISHVAYDRTHTSAADPKCWMPLEQLRRAAVSGRVRLAARLHCAPTNRSQRTTREIDAPEVLRRCVEDGAEVALLVPI